MKLKMRTADMSYQGRMSFLESKVAERRKLLADGKDFRCQICNIEGPGKWVDYMGKLVWICKECRKEAI